MAGAVVGSHPGDDLGLGRLAGQLVVLLRDFPGRLNCLTTASGEKDSVEIFGCVRK